MSEFSAKRIVKEYKHTVTGPPEKVFPLLCPIREYDWIDGWECDLVYSKSGVAEDHCIFKTNMHGRGDSTWMITNYEPDNFIIGFSIFYENGIIEKLNINLVEKADGKTEATWTRTYTGLSEAGNDFISHFAEEAFTPMMDWVAQSLQHFIMTGEMLRKEEG